MKNLNLYNFIKKSTALFALLLLLAGASLKAQNLFNNGSFTGTKGGGVVAPGWTGTSTPDLNDEIGPLQSVYGYAWYGGTPVASPDGGTWQNLATNETVYQTVSGLIVGQQYKFSYHYASQGIFYTPNPSTIYANITPPSVTVTGMSGYSNPASVGALFEWKTYTGTLTATATTATFTFQGGSSAWNYRAYDGASLSLFFPDAGLTKSISPASITDGETATYTFTITNTATGSGALSGLSFTDALPSGLRIASTPNVMVNGITGGTVTAAAGGTSIGVSGYSIAAGATATITVDVTNAPGQLNPSCGANPAAFTNSAANISGLSLNLANNVGNVCLAVYCAAGNTAPTLTNATVTSQTVNLSSMVTGTPPGTSVLQWHTTATPVDGTTLVSMPVTATSTPTNYYAVYYDSNANCYSPGAKVTVMSNICPGITADLTSLPHSAAPTGADLVWYTTPAHTPGTEVTDPAAVGNGTYWSFFYDNASTCFSPVSTPVVVGIENCVVCNAGATGPDMN